MEAIFIYFLKANGLLVTFFLAYYFLLRKETFFNKNRWFLLMGLFASVLLPLITFTKTIWVEPSPIVYETASNDFIPYIIENKVIEEPIDWNSVLFYVYLGISVVFIVKILIEILSFFRIIKFGKRTKTKEALLIDNESNENPFSFFNHIVFNSKMFSEDELQHIIFHEKIHVKEKHSIDVLISKVFCAMFWVNPIMWFYQKEMLQNLEYIADEKASSIAQNRINYQKTLLKVVTNQHQLSITNQFYQSLIKKRIVMLNTNQSNQRKSWKYALILPVLSAFMLLFQVETVAQVKENSSNINKTATKSVAVAVGFVTDKNATDAEMKLDTEELKKQGIDYKFSKIKRNKKGEIIAIKIEFNDNNGNNGVKVINGKDPIEPIYFSTENNNIGFTDAPDLSDYIVDEKLSKQFGTEIKIKKATVNGIEKIGINWDDAKKISESENLEHKNRLYIINDKEYLQSEIPKGTTVEVDGTISELGKEEGIKKYGQKAKDGVLIFEGKSTFVLEEEQIKKVKLEIERTEKEIEKAKIEIEKAKPEIERAKIEIEKAKIEIEKSKPEIEKAKIEIEKARFEIENSKPEFEMSNRKVISGGNWSDIEKELQKNNKREMELKSQQNSKLTKEELAERRNKIEQIREDKRKKIEEKKKEIETRRKQIEEKRNE